MKPEDVPEKWHRAVVAAYIALGAAPDGPEEVDIPSHNDVAFILAAVIPAIQAEALDRAAGVFDERARNLDKLARMFSGEAAQAVNQLVIAHHASAAAIRAMKEPTP
jgi:hypothetical protein